MGRGLFIAGTDTGVGKTIVAGGIAGALRRRGVDAGVMKPFATGALRVNGSLVSADALFLQAASGVSDGLDAITPVCLEAPAAPSVAAALLGRRLAPPDVWDIFAALARRHDCMVVEGIGGLLVPISGSYMVADLARDLDLNLLIVGRAALGAINHTLLTVRCAEEYNLRIKGIVLNATTPDPPGLADRTNAAVIEELGCKPVLGTIPFLPGVTVDPPVPGPVVETIERLLPLDWLLEE